jgi:hypothetical protein
MHVLRNPMTPEDMTLQHVRKLMQRDFPLTDAERAQMQAAPEQEHVFVRRHYIDMGDGRYQIYSVEQRHRLISRSTYDPKTKQHTKHKFADVAEETSRE